MLKITLINHDINLDFSTSDIKRTVIKQDSNQTHGLTIKLYDNNGRITLDTNWQYTISCRKADNTFIVNSNNISVSSNTIYVEITKQMTSCPGTEKCELLIQDGSQTLYSGTFYLYIEANVNYGSALESTNEYDSLSDTLNQMREYEKESEKVKDHIQDISTNIDATYDELTEAVNTTNDLIEKNKVIEADEAVRKENETNREANERKRQTDTANAIKNANDAADNANSKANDLQNKLDSHYFALTDDLQTHDSSSNSHDDIRNLISNLTTRLNALADSDDTTLDQLSEIVAYIKNNKSLIDNVTTSKINVSDIIDNLTSTAVNKPLSAKQGKVIKDLIDALTTAVGNKVDKVSGKGLSTNDYTTAEKNKLSSIAAGAEANVQVDWNETNTSSDAYIKNKPTIPVAVRVKGDSESTYRTGDVNITAKNVGALPTSGGEVTGDVIFDKYVGIKAWPNYGEGVAKAWYNANTKTIDFDGGVLNIDLNATSAKNADTLGGMDKNQFVHKANPVFDGNLNCRGDIWFNGEVASKLMIQFLESGNADGHGISIGGGGMTVIGGGESAYTIAQYYTNDGTAKNGGAEKMIVGNDGIIEFLTNCQNGFSSAKHITMNTDGTITAEGFNGKSITSSLGSGTHLAGNQGKAIINSTAAGTGYNMLARMKSPNGVWTLGSYQGEFVLYYTGDELISAGTNAITRAVALFREDGTSSFAFANHTHSNYLTGITKNMVTNALGYTPPSTNTTYSVATQSANGLMSAADKKKLDGVAANANNYTHPTTTGNRHIPSGGSSGEFLRNLGDGIAVWADATDILNGESGTWTPTVGYQGSTNYAFENGKYIKIGKVVYCSLEIKMYATSTVRESIYIDKTSLPFTLIGGRFMGGQLYDLTSNQVLPLRVASPIGSLLATSSIDINKQAPTHYVTFEYCVN